MHQARLRVEAVQMRDLGIGTVADHGRMHEAIDLAQRWQILRKPVDEQVGIKHIGHQQRFGQCRREKFVAARLVVRRIIGVACVVAACGVDDGAFQFRILAMTRKVQYQLQGESAVEMSADPDRIAELCKIA